MDYLTDQQYADLTGNTPDAGWGYFDPSTTDYYGDSSYTPMYDSGYTNDYYNLADQLSGYGLIPTDQYGAPDLSSLLNLQYTDAMGGAGLGDLSQYTPTGTPLGMDFAQQQAIQDASLNGLGYESVIGNPNVVVDPTTGELVDKMDLPDRQSVADRLMMEKYGQSKMNTGLNDYLSKDKYGISTLDPQGNVIAQQGEYSAPYDIANPQSFEDAANLIAFQAQPGGGLYKDDQSNDYLKYLQKGLSGALSMFKGSPAAQQAATRALTGNANNAAGSGAGRQSMSLAEMAALMAGALQKGGGKAPGDSRANPGAQGWNISRKAGSGREKKASGGALGLLRGGQPGQEDKVPIDASHGEYVFDADTVSALGDGNTEAGAKKLDEMRMEIRKHKRSAPVNKIPPKAKSPLAYMKGGK